MKTIPAAVLFAVLAASSVGSAFAQKTGALELKPAPRMKPLIQCTMAKADPRGPQPCESRQENEAARYASDVTRQELECILSGACTSPEMGG